MYAYYLNRQIFLKVFFEVIVTYPIYMGMKIILLRNLLKQNAKQNASKVPSKIQKWQKREIGMAN